MILILYVIFLILASRGKFNKVYIRFTHRQTHTHTHTIVNNLVYVLDPLSQSR